MVRDSVKFLVDTMLKNDVKSQNVEFDKNVRPNEDEEIVQNTIRLNGEILGHQKNCFMC